VTLCYITVFLVTVRCCYYTAVSYRDVSLTPVVVNILV